MRLFLKPPVSFTFMGVLGGGGSLHSRSVTGSNYWLNLDFRNKLAGSERALSGLYLSFSCFSLGYTSTLDSLHLSRQILNVKGRKRNGKKKKLYTSRTPVWFSTNHFFLEAAIIERETLKRKGLAGLFQVWSEENFDEATTLRKSCKVVWWCCSSPSPRQQKGCSFTSKQLLSCRQRWECSLWRELT